MNEFSLKYPKTSGLIVFVITTAVLFIPGVLFILAFGGTSPKSPSGQPTGASMDIVIVAGFAFLIILPIALIAGILSSVIFVRRKNRMS